jgi:flagellar motor switch protein FliM
VRPHQNTLSGLPAPSAPGPGARLPRVREVDFRRPSKFARDQIRRLQTAHEGFCRSASSRLSAELRTGLQLDVIGTDQLPYATVMAEEVPPHALVTVLDVDPLGTEIVLIMEMQLALALVDRLLGGAGMTPSAASGMTEVEVAVARRALSSLIEPLSDTWLDFADVQLSIATTSTLPMTVQIVPPSEPTLLLNFQVDVDGLFSVVTLCMPHRSVAPLMERLEQNHYGAPVVDSDSAAAVRSAMKGVEVEMRAEVGSIDMTVEEVLALRPGDTVGLERKVDDGATLLAANVPAYRVAPGRNGRARAVQVRERWSEVS